MATAGLPLWSTTAASNATADPAVNFAEGMAPSAVNDSARALMASAAKWRDDLYGITSGLSTGGTSTAFTVTTNSTYASAAVMNGAIFSIIPHVDSGAAVTLAVDGLTARAINYSSGIAIAPAALKASTPYFVRYVHATTEFIVIGTTLIASQLSIINNLTEDTSPDGAADFLLSYDNSATAAKKVKPSSLPVVLARGYIDGCIISNGTDTTNDINIAAGVCRDSTNTVNINIAALAGKQLDANWAAGAAAGMRNSAAGITDTTYHIYAVRTAASETADIYAHTSTTVATVLTALQAETGGASYVYARRIGSIVRSSAAILGFTQRGDHFEYTVPNLDITVTTPGTSALTRSLATIPLGVAVRADLSFFQNGSGDFIYASSLTVSDQAPANNAAPLASAGSVGSTAFGSKLVWTNTSTQIRVRTNDGVTTLQGVTLGYFDPRGKDS